MNKYEAIEKLNAIEAGDTEAAHSEADRILLQFLADSGFKDIANAWESVDDRVDGFWYA